MISSFGKRIKRIKTAVLRLASLLPQNWYRDVWLFCVTALVVAALSSVHEQTNEIHKQTNEVQSGRRAVSGVSCAVSAAVVKAGRLTIISSSKQGLPPKLEMFLEEHGLPAKKVREQSAVRSAESYSKGINTEIVKVSGVSPHAVLNKDGTLNCNKLRALAKIK